jgi:drug/metabolite transporter (DMT)-like permease
MAALADPAKGEALALVALALFSCNIVLTKVASARLAVSAGFLVAVTANIAVSAALFAVELAWRSRPLQWDGFGVLLYALAGVFSTYLGRWFFFEAITRLGPARASIFQVSSPLFTVIIAWIALADALAPAAIGAMVLTLIGLVIVSASPTQLLRLAAGGPSPAVERATSGGHGEARTGRLKALLRSGLLLGTTSSAAYAVGNVLRGAGSRRWDEPVLGALIGAVAAIALQLALTRGNAQAWRLLRGAKRTGILLFAAGGAMTITAQICVIAAMSHTAIGVVALITLCTPILVVPMSYFLLKNQEGITGRTIVGGVLVLAGIAALALR